MDIYAAIYWCPTPGCGHLLETPSNQWGQRVTCTACMASFAAPRDDVLHEHEGDAGEGLVLYFDCPSCNDQLRCDSLRSGLPMRGQRVVCLRCRNLIEVPAGGSSLGGEQGDERTHPGERRCPNPTCARRIPHRAEHCPLCGTAIPVLPVSR
jgi:hypothetical protein